VQNRRL